MTKLTAIIIIIQNVVMIRSSIIDLIAGVDISLCIPIDWTLSNEL